MRRIFALLLLLPSLAWGAETYYVRGTTDCPTNGDGTAYACAATNGGVGAWSGTGNISFGTTASTFGRGDTLHICDTQSTAVTVGSVGAFDGTVNADSDVVFIDGAAASCGGTQGKFSGVTGNAINASGQLAVYVQDLTFDTVTGNGFQNLIGAQTCSAASGYYCSKAARLTCTNVGSSSGHCAHVAWQSNAAFPTTDIAAILQEDITSSGSGGSACRIFMRSTGATQRRCTSSGGEGAVSNSWPVYIAGMFVNCGTANSGAGVTWTQVAGTQYKSTTTSCGGGTGKTVLDVFKPIHAVGVPARLAQDGSCTGDGDCATSTGQWGQVGDTIYINAGNTPQATATVNLTYGIAASPLITQASVTSPSGAFDGISTGFDAGVTGGVLERSYSYGAPAYGFAVSGGAYSSTIQSSISQNSGTAGVRHISDGAVYNVSTAGSSLAVSVRTNSGQTIIVKNVGGSGLTSAVTDDLSEGTLTTGGNSTADPGFVGGLTPANAAGFRLSPSSPLRRAGTDLNLGNIQDHGNRAFMHPPSIGAWEAASGDESSARTAAGVRTEASARTAASARAAR